jgi:hypothetical protein
MIGKFCKKVNFGHLSITFVFRHKWDSPNDRYENRFEYKTKRLGLFWRKDKTIGTKYTGKNLFNKKNHFPKFMIGLNLIYAKCWIDVGWRVKTFEIKNTNHIPEDGC